MTDNSYMFVDEDKEDISEAGGVEPKGKYLDEAVTGKIEDKSTINLVADEDVSRELSFQEKLEKKASDIQENLHESIEENVNNNPTEASSVALDSERMLEKGNGFGVASLVCGIISLTLFCSFFNLFASILSLVFGVIHMRRGKGKAIAIVGIVCSVCSVILLVICMSLIMSNTAFVDMITSSMLNMGVFSIK